MMKQFLTLTLVAGAGAPAVAEEPAPIDFDIDAGKVVPAEDFMVMVSVLGSAITSRGVDIPVTVQLQVGDQQIDPWGDFGSHAAANVNDPYAPTRNYIVGDSFQGGDANTAVTVTSRSWLNGSVHIQANSAEQSQQVKVLRDGDPVPDISGFADQADALYFIEPYVNFNTGKIDIDQNQAIYLFEIGTTNVSSSAADFQDLVVLVTFGKSKRDFFKYTAQEALYD